ncbi:soluble NSF attachment family protein [Pandoraea sputorum]|nr:hypothetical protein [Pandoraea sputorum]
MVSAAHEGLQAQVLEIFPPETFDGMDPTGVKRALASLILLYFAGQWHQTTQWIEPGRDEALRTVSGRLTPTGQQALLQSLENSQGENAFSKYFAQPESQYFAQVDAYCLAGHLCVPRADDRRPAGDPDTTPEDAHAQATGVSTDLGPSLKAPETYLKVAHALKADADARPEKGRYAHAGAAYRLAAKPSLGQNQAGPAAAYLWAAQALTRAHQLDQALTCFKDAAKANAQAHRPGLAGDAWRSVAEIHTERGEHDLASEALIKAALAYRDAALGDTEARQGLPGAIYHLMAAYAYQAAGQKPLAAAAFINAADAFMDENLFLEATEVYALVGLPKQAIEACEKAVDAYRAADAFVPAAEACRTLGILLRTHGGPLDDERRAFLDAAELYAKVGEVRAYEAAADACIEANEYLQAAQFYELANMLDLAGFACEQIGEYRLAHTFYLRVSEQSQDDETRTQFAELAEEVAALAGPSDPKL